MDAFSHPQVGESAFPKLGDSKLPITPLHDFVAEPPSMSHNTVYPSESAPRSSYPSRLRRNGHIFGESVAVSGFGGDLAIFSAIWWPFRGFSVKRPYFQRFGGRLGVLSSFGHIFGDLMAKSRRSRKFSPRCTRKTSLTGLHNSNLLKARRGLSVCGKFCTFAA